MPLFDVFAAAIFILMLSLAAAFHAIISMMPFRHWCFSRLFRRFWSLSTVTPMLIFSSPSMMPLIIIMRCDYWCISLIFAAWYSLFIFAFARCYFHYYAIICRIHYYYHWFIYCFRFIIAAIFPFISPLLLFISLLLLISRLSPLLLFFSIIIFIYFRHYSRCCCHYFLHFAYFFFHAHYFRIIFRHSPRCLSLMMTFFSFFASFRFFFSLFSPAAVAFAITPFFSMPFSILRRYFYAAFFVFDYFLRPFARLLILDAMIDAWYSARRYFIISLFIDIFDYYFDFIERHYFVILSPYWCHYMLMPSLRHDCCLRDWYCRLHALILLPRFAAMARLIIKISHIIPRYAIRIFRFCLFHYAMAIIIICCFMLRYYWAHDILMLRYITPFRFRHYAFRLQAIFIICRHFLAPLFSIAFADFSDIMIVSFCYCCCLPYYWCYFCHYFPLPCWYCCCRFSLRYCFHFAMLFPPWYCLLRLRWCSFRWLFPCWFCLLMLFRYFCWLLITFAILFHFTPLIFAIIILFRWYYFAFRFATAFFAMIFIFCSLLFRFSLLFTPLFFSLSILPLFLSMLTFRYAADAIISLICTFSRFSIFSSRWFRCWCFSLRYFSCHYYYFFRFSAFLFIIITPFFFRFSFIYIFCFYDIFLSADIFRCLPFSLIVAIFFICFHFAIRLFIFCCYWLPLPLWYAFRFLIIISLLFRRHWYFFSLLSFIILIDYYVDYFRCIIIFDITPFHYYACLSIRYYCFHIIISFYYYFLSLFASLLYLLRLFHFLSSFSLLLFSLFAMPSLHYFITYYLHIFLFHILLYYYIIMIILLIFIFSLYYAIIMLLPFSPLRLFSLFSLPLLLPFSPLIFLHWLFSPLFRHYAITPLFPHFAAHYFHLLIFSPFSSLPIITLHFLIFRLSPAAHYYYYIIIISYYFDAFFFSLFWLLFHFHIDISPLFLMMLIIAIYYYWFSITPLFIARYVHVITPYFSFL